MLQYKYQFNNKLCDFFKCRSLVSLGVRLCKNCIDKRSSHTISEMNRRQKDVKAAYKHKVRCKVQYAIRKGEIIREPCEVYTCDIIGEAHHDDYDKPLEVRWLCSHHHQQHHWNLQ